MSQQSLHKNSTEQKGEVQYLFVGHKAGLDNVDKDKITKIINETTQTSEFYKRQQMKREQYDERIKEMNTIIEQTKQDPIKLLKVKQECEEKLDQLRQLIQTDRVWVHCDMDMFFVACELKDRPELKDLPVAVGGMSMISTANYIARKFGVRSAMPGFIAKKLCPQLILIPCNFDKYRKASEQFKKVLYHYDPNLESMGLDEANLDITDYLQQNDINTDAQIYDICNQIRKQVIESTGGLTCSCGIGPNKMLAKICSDMNKPNGQYQLANDEEKIKDFMKELPIRKIPGIGNVTEQILKGIGIEKCSQILERILDLKICFRDLSFDHLVSSALGIGRSWHEEEVEKKSLSVSRTFQQISTIEEIHEKIHYISEKLAKDAKDEQKVGKHLAVSFKNIKFQTRSKNRMIGKYIQDSESIEKIAKELVKELLPTEPLRLIGIRLSQLANENEIKNQGLNKYFSKTDKNNNESMIQSSKRSSKQSKNINTQLSLKNIFQNQHDNMISETSNNNQKMADFQYSTDNSFSHPFLADVSNTSQMVESISNQKLGNNKQMQPSFLSIIDKYESEGGCDMNDKEDGNDQSDCDLQKKAINNLSQLQQNKKLEFKQNNFTDESSFEEDDEDEDDDERNSVKQENDDQPEKDDDDDEDDLAYLKKILNKNVSDRLSQISEKKSQEDQRQSLSEKNSMTPQFVFQNGLSQIQRYSQSQEDRNKKMIPEAPQQYPSFQSQAGCTQTQYFQRKDDQNTDQESMQSFQYMNMMQSGESSKFEIQMKRSPLKPKMISEKENSNSIYVYDEYAEQMSQQYQHSQSQSSSKRRIPADPLTPAQIEEQLQLKKKFIPRLFECPICFQQLDSYGNATFVNTHITNCMKTQEEKFNKLEQNNQQIGENGQMQETRPTSIFNNLTSKQPTKRKLSDQRQRKSGQKKNSGTKHTLDSYIIKSKN